MVKLLRTLCINPVSRSGRGEDAAPALVGSYGVGERGRIAGYRGEAA
jgi:hypothetical protein